nr:copia protein [Tanacetum cinerariifolium]
MQEELLQFHLQKVWTLVDLPRGKRVIGTKWVFRDKKDERGIVIRNKARLVAQGCTQEEGIDYDKVFAPVGRIEAIRLFLAYASFIGFLVYQMDIKSAFLYGRIKEERQDCSNLVHQKIKRGYAACTSYEDVKPASTPMDKEKALLKDSDGDDVDVHLYRSMIGSLMYLTSSRPDIIFIFWRTASVRTLENREIKLNATVDGQVKTITKASVKRHLKLADANVLTQNVFRNIKRESMGFFGVEAALFPTMLVTKQVFQGEGPTSPVGTQHTPTIIESSPHLQNVSITYRKTRTKTGRMVIRIPQSNVASSATDEAITKEMHDGLGMATATASSLAAEQGSGNISKTQTKATPSGLSSPRTSLEGSLGCHFTTRDSPVQASPVQASPERLFDLPNEPPLGEGNTS